MLDGTPGTLKSQLVETPLLKYAERETLQPRLWNVPEHAHEHHELLVVVKGAQRSWVRGVELIAGPGDILMYSAGTPHEESLVEGEEVIKYTLGFVWDGDLSDVPVLLPDRSGRLTELSSWIAAEAPNKGDISPPIVEPLVQGLIGEVIRTSRRAGQELKDRARRIVRARMSEISSVTDLAALLEMSRSHFCRRFQAEAGVSPSEFLRTERLSRAVHLLRSTNLAVKEIAAEVGVSSEQQLCRLVRQSYGITTRQVRAGSIGSA